MRTALRAGLNCPDVCCNAHEEGPLLKESLQAAENDLSERLRHHSREALEKIARRLGQYEVIKQSYDLPELVEMILNAWREKRSEDLCMRLGWNAYQSICDLLHTCKQEGGGFSLPYYELSMRSRESIMELHDLGLAFEDDQSGWYISALVEAYLSSVDDELQEQMRMSDSILWPLDSLLEKWGLCELHLFSRTLQCYFSDSPIDFSDTDITRVLEARRGTDAFVSWEDEVYVVSRNWRQNPRLMEDMCGCLYHKLPYASFHDVSEMFKSSNIRGLSLNLAAYQYLALLDPSPEIPWNSSASIESIWEICMLRARESWRSAMLLSALFRAGILIKRGHPRKARKLLLTSARDCIARCEEATASEMDHP